MSYIIDDLLWGVGKTATNPQGGVWSKLAQRSDLVARGIYEMATDVILNLSRNFRFPLLERTGPTVTLNVNQPSYTPGYLILPSDTNQVANLIPSFVRYFQPNTPPVVGNGNTNSTLKWKTIDALELMFNTPGIPTYFTRYSNLYWVAPIPDNSYYAFLRYQVQHPFTGDATGQPLAVGSDSFLLPNEWKVVAEYAIAEQGAIALRMMDYAKDYHTILYGDPEGQRSTEGRGNPGLIYRLISQMEGDSQSMTKSLRVNVQKP